MKKLILFGWWNLILFIISVICLIISINIKNWLFVGAFIVFGLSQLLMGFVGIISSK